MGHTHEISKDNDWIDFHDTNGHSIGSMAARDAYRVLKDAGLLRRGDGRSIPGKKVKKPYCQSGGCPEDATHMIDDGKHACYSCEKHTGQFNGEVTEIPEAV